MLVESLDDAVQADVWLGLVVARTAVALARLPRGNQAEAAQLAVRRGMTFRQTEALVTQLLTLPDDSIRSAEVRKRLDGPVRTSQPPAAARARHVVTLN